MGTATEIADTAGPDIPATMLPALLLLAVAASASAQSAGFGGCPKDVTVKQDFDIVKYMGKWYEQGRISNLFQRNLKCSTAQYTLQDSGTVHVDNSAIDRDSGELVQAIGEGVILDASEPAKLGVRFYEFQPYAPYWVIDTDYDTYTFVWSCESLGPLGHAQFVWIMRREKVLDPAIVSDLMEMGRNMGIKVEDVIFEDHD